MEKLLSICVPTYNGEKTIGRMLEVLLPQADEEIEIIISDNYSTDSTAVIVEKFKTLYPFVKYVRNDSNVGADRNFLQCMKMATGKFCMLLSDDDILIEGSLQKIKDFLNKNGDVSLVYLYTISFKDKYIDVSSCSSFDEYSKKPVEDFVTTSKKEFIEYVGRQWGFTSSFLWKTSRCQEIKDVERFFDTYWLQSYVHIYCSNIENDKLGVTSFPCIAAGGYGIIPNFDAYAVEVVAFKSMLDFACDEARYDSRQFEELWLWKICYVLKRQIIKERSIDRNLTSCKSTFLVLKKYPYAWFNLFPFMLLPNWFCKLILKIWRFKEGRRSKTYVNREVL